MRGALEFATGRAGDRCLCQAEIDDLHVDWWPGVGEHDIARFEVAVDDSPCMGRCQRGCRLAQDFKRLAKRKRAKLAHPLRESTAGAVVHRVIDLPAIADAEVAQQRDMFVGQPRKGPALVEETLADLVVGGKIAPDHLDRHFSA